MALAAANTKTLDRTAPVETTGGVVTGVVRSSDLAFLGIPYAKARRFAAPQPADPWSGTRAATTIGFAAPQTEHPVPGVAASGPQDEACLNLNVFTPAADGKRRPVLVWIHGGGFTHGAGYEPLYDGGLLAARGDVVVVTTNYRLGALGFLRLPAIGAKGNQGLLDQIAALGWVRDNVGAFGGDPGNVTVFGESAGSASVSCLLAMPGARGLFRRAIMQSGVGRAASPEQADGVADLLLEKLGLDRARAAELLGLAPARILGAQAAVAEKLGSGFGIGFGPVRDDVTLPVAPIEAVAAGAAKDIEIVIGSTRDEAKLFVPPKRDPLDQAGLVKAVRALLPKADDKGAAELAEAYRAAWRKAGLPHDNLDVIDALLGDLRFRLPSLRLAAAQSSAGGKAYMYLFAHASPARRGALGACHGLDLPFTFGTLTAPTQDRFAGTGPAVERLAGEMMDAWLAFARTGNPSHGSIAPWSPYDETRRPTMVFGTQVSRQEDDPFGEARRAAEAVPRGGESHRLH
jgi:para-nitrobenzyl esterase